MAVVSGTIRGVQFLSSSLSLTGVGSDETYLVTSDFGAYDASADTATLVDVGATISARARDGKTRTLRGAVGSGGAKDNAGQVVYIGAPTVSTDALTFSLTAVDRSTEVADFTSVSGVQCIVVVTAA